MRVHSRTRRFARFYAVWILIALMLATIGWGDQKAGHGLLILTGFPLSLLSMQLLPHGSVLATLCAGLLGCLQWCVVIELDARWGGRRGVEK
jgi:hypothetical protein